MATNYVPGTEPAYDRKPKTQFNKKDDGSALDESKASVALNKGAA